MGMASNFVILHLSDAHIGKSGDGTDENKVRKSLLDDIAEIHKKRNLTPNMIIFSGDIIQGCGSPCIGESCPDKQGKDWAECRLHNQYEEAKDFLQKVAERANTSLGETPLVIVPGNHDVNRHRVNLDQQYARDRYNRKRVEDLQKDVLSWQATLHRQAQWLEFAKELPHPQCLKWDDKFNVPYGFVNVNGTKIGFTGLNTSWCACSNEERHQLWLGNNQLDHLCQKISEADFKIAISHHPCGWLHADEQKLGHKIETFFDVYFHGHEHDNWFVDSAGHLIVHGGAAYENSEERNTYCWLDLDLDGKSGTIHVRKYSDEGGGGWIPASVPGKIDSNGESRISALFTSQDDREAITTGGAAPKTAAPLHSQGTFPKTTLELVDTLQDKFDLRWEPHSYPENPGGTTQVFWPVRLRQTTAIHASQCFVAAGLLKTGCCINLFVDDLGTKDEKPENFKSKMKAWIKKAGGEVGSDKLRILDYGEIEKNDVGRQDKAQALEQLLTAETFRTNRILEISKICSISNELNTMTPEKKAEAIAAIVRHRPRRLLTPAMTWTCLKTLHDKFPGHSIITLGGDDETVLWETWRDCFLPVDYPIGHLYVSELTGLHMATNPFHWSSRKDIKRDFAEAVAKERPFDSSNKMIPWCVNNCGFLPSYIAEQAPLAVGKAGVCNVNQLHELDPKADLPDIVEAVAEWVL